MRRWTTAASALLFLATLISANPSPAPAKSEQQILSTTASATYDLGQAIPVTCLNRSIETGEHVIDPLTKQLQYIPFSACNETGVPLTIPYGLDTEITCTIDFIDDSFFHLLEFIIHQDSPFTCRIPSSPLGAATSHLTPATAGSPETPDAFAANYIPLIFALTGTLQLSHLHVANNLNLLLHTPAEESGVIDAATAYSVSHTTSQQRVVIGDSLPLKLSVRWIEGTTIPRGAGGLGGHVFASTIVYCMLSAGAATAVCIAWFRGVELPRRLRTYGRDTIRGERGGLPGGGMAGGVYNGYAYGGGGGGSGQSYGKRD